jgi:plastocyanin
VIALAAIGVLVLFGTARSSSRPTVRIPEHHVVEIRGMAFHPRELTAGTGDTIVWINRDIVPHTATSAGHAAWDTGPLTQGESAEQVVRETGEQPYFCRLHPVMMGKVIVR